MATNSLIRTVYLVNLEMLDSILFLVFESDAIVLDEGLDRDGPSRRRDHLQYVLYEPHLVKR